MHKHEIEFDGGLVLWSLSPSDRELIRSLYDAHGFDGFTPDYQSDTLALKAALADYKGKDQRVEPLQKPGTNGYELVEVERGEDRNYHTHSFSVRVEDGVVIGRGGYADTDRLQELFAQHKARLTPSAVGRSLVGILGSLGAVTIRGGLYWLPDDALDRWEPVARGVERAAVTQNGSAVHMIHTARTEATVRTIRDALVAEITTASEAIREEVERGTLGEEALDNRKDQAAAMRNRITRYQDILGKWQDELGKLVDATERSAVVAALKLMPSMAVTG